MRRTFSDWGLSIIAFAIVILVNYLATALPIGGQTTGEISDKYPSLFTPAGFTFSIWGIIYLGLLGFVIYQALPAKREDSEMAGISRLFQISCAFNASWIFAWHYDLLFISLILMIGIWVSLILIYKKLNNARNEFSAGPSLLMRVPFSIYTGWITVAFIANLSAVQIGNGWDNLWLDAITWTQIKLGIAGAAAAIVGLRRRDIAYLAVIAWAAFGISAKQTATPEISGAAGSLCVFAIILIIYEVYRRIRKEPLLST
ncbi:MAG: tryptophan-rich sensory protein [Bacteroidota bacterium]